VDKAGNNKWTVFKRILVKHGESMLVPFGKDDQGEWIRAISDKSTRLTLNFTYSNGDDRLPVTDQMYDGLARVSDDNVKAGLLWGVGDNRRVLGLLAGTADNNSFTETGYYELDSLMNLVKKEDIKTVSYIREKMGIPENVVTIDDASVLVIDDKGRRWRLPKGNQRYDSLTSDGLLRICREVVTERDLFNCYGTFYELPAENADGYAKIRPVASHNLRIHDYSSYRGLCIMTGIQNDLPSDNPHIIRSNDGKAAVWAGVIDDLWKLGKPVGSGGPWKESKVKAGEPSDAYLIGFYDKRSLHLSHDSEKQVVFKIEADPAGNGQWMKYMDFSVEPGENYDYSFPETFQARWIRVIADSDCKATAFLKYE
jgi:hypothetical protein